MRGPYGKKRRKPGRKRKRQRLMLRRGMNERNKRQRKKEKVHKRLRGPVVLQCRKERLKHLKGGETSAAEIFEGAKKEMERKL